MFVVSMLNLGGVYQGLAGANEGEDESEQEA